MNIIFINCKTFKRFKNTKYFCDEDGNIYSEYSRRILTPMTRCIGSKQYLYIDINFGNGQKHYPIHKIVYETWIGEIIKGMSVLHKDDDSFNNNFNNLYLGTQKDNIKDCIKNGHRVGNLWILTIYDKELDETLTFCPAYKFIEYSKHPCKNGCVNRVFSRNWFKKRYEVIDYRLCKNINDIKGVTTMGDECNPVDQSLSLAGVRNIHYVDEEIV